MTRSIDATGNSEMARGDAGPRLRNANATAGAYSALAVASCAAVLEKTMYSSNERRRSGGNTLASRWLLVAMAIAILSLAGCGGGGSSGDGTTPPTNQGFELRLGAASVPVRQDSNGLLRVRIERQAGFSGAIELSMANPAPGIAATAVVVEPDQDEARLPLRIAADAPLGQKGVVIQGSAGGATATVQLQLDVQPPQPKSQELIQAALTEGQIDLGTSLLYRAYAVFGSSKLPEEFVGSGPVEDLALIADIEDAKASLPQTIVDALQPFLVRPDDPRSVFNAGQPISLEQPTARERPMAAMPSADHCPGDRRQWITQRSTQHPVRAFALCRGTPGDDLSARNELFKIIAVVDRAYGMMVANMGPAVPDLWGDDAIDVYVVPENADAPRERGDYAIEAVRGATIPEPPPAAQPQAAQRSTAFVMLPRSRIAQGDYFLTVIHELFHVLQCAHNYELGKHWFTEASATWASIHFNREASIDPPANQGLHDERFGGFQESPLGLAGTAGHNEYFSYAWPLFMEQEVGAARIGAAWSALESAVSHEQATDRIDAMLPFEQHFREFALRNLNQAYGPDDPLPRAQRNVALDPPFPDGLLLPKDGVKSKSHDIAAGPKETLDFGRPIEPLSAVYFNLTVTDGALKKVVFDLSGLRTDGLDVDALVLIDQKWEAKPRNLNGTSELTFCLDDPKERLWMIIFVVSNHQKRDGLQTSAKLGVTGYNEPCNTVWTGNTSVEFTSPGFKASATASVVFEFDDTAPPGALQSFRLRSGSYSYRGNQQGPCPITVSAEGKMFRAAFPDRSAPGSTFASLSILALPLPAQYTGSGATGVEYREVDCRGEETSGQTIIGWWALDGEFFSVSEDGNTLEGSRESSSAELTVRQRWQFTRTRN